MTVRLLHGHCVEVLATLPAASFDVCIADPPYGDTSLDWDTVVPDWVPAVARVLKAAASIWLFGSLRSLALAFRDMEAHGFRYSQDVVWEKQNGTGFHADRFRRVHEHAALFYRGRWDEVWHQPQFTDDATARTVRRKTRPTHTGHIEAGSYTSEDGGPRLMRSVLQVRNEHGRAIHPTQKPLELLAPLIRYSMPPGGAMIDPFTGSASSLMVAKADGLDAVGIEIDGAMVEKARARLDADMPLFDEVAE